MSLKRFHLAELVLLSRYAEWRTALGEAHTRTQRARLFLVRLYEAWGKPERAAIYRAEYQTVLSS